MQIAKGDMQALPDLALGGHAVGPVDGLSGHR
jgi:hypothetical protein